MNEIVPPLPSEISRDGREIWDWAAKLSERTHLVHRFRELSAGVDRTKNRCGSCTAWMTKRCPREVQNNQIGRSQGPSGDAMKCKEFVMTSHAAKNLEGAEAELKELRSKLGAPNAR